MNRSGSKGRGRETEIETFQPEVKLPEEKALKIDEGLYEEIRGGPQSNGPLEQRSWHVLIILFVALMTE